GFIEEARRDVGIARVFRAQDFYRCAYLDVIAQCLVDHTHASLAEEAQHAIWSDALVLHERKEAGLLMKSKKLRRYTLSAEHRRESKGFGRLRLSLSDYLAGYFYRTALALIRRSQSR